MYLAATRQHCTKPTLSHLLSACPQAPSEPLDQAQARLEEELNQPGAEGGPRPLGETEIARGVENLMGAMRELLNTLSFRGPPEGEREDGEPNNDGEWEEEEQ